MARNIRSKLESRSNRLALKPRRKPVYERIGTKTAGTWVLRCASGGNEWTKGFADADDYEASNQKSVMTYFEAQTYARTLAGAGKDGTATAGHRPVTVGEAVDDYEAHLTKHGRDAKNAQRVRYHLKSAHGLANIGVASLVPTEFKAWEKSFTGRTAATTNRVNNSLKAALNAAAKHDDRITNAKVWTIALERLAGADRSRNVILLQPT